MNSSNKYPGEEKISKLLIKFSIPCVMGLLISALYNIVDQISIGNSEPGYYGNAAPLSDIISIFVITVLTVSFFRKTASNAEKIPHPEL